VTTELLNAQVDREIYERLNEYVKLIGVDRDAVVNEALKHYLCGRVPASGLRIESQTNISDSHVQVSMK